MDFHETVLHRRLPFPPVNHNDCNGNCRLCVFPLDSIRPAARREGEREGHIIETTCGRCDDGFLVHFVLFYLLSGNISWSFAFSSSMLRPRARMVPSGAKSIVSGMVTKPYAFAALSWVLSSCGLKTTACIHQVTTSDSPKES